jgi:hypothetical protein
MAINFNNQNKGIGTLDLSEYGLMQPQNQNMQVAGGYDTPTEGQYGFNLIELDRLKRAGYDPEEVSTYPNKEDVQSLIRSLEPTSMAISNYEQLFGPKIMTDANQSLYTGMMDQSGTPIDYTDRIMNSNLPGFAYQPKESLKNIIGSQLQNAKTKVGQGFDFAKQIPNMLFSAATGIPFAGQIAQGIGGLLSNIFQESPEQKNFKENIATDPEYQNLVSQIPGMSNYNQIFGMGSGRGLLGAADRRLATINKTLGRMTPQQLAKTSLKKRKAKLEALKELEKQKESAFLESQRRGRAPTAPSGGGSQDTGAASGFSPGQAGAGTGGYSYDSGGRKGFGYGLKDGGLASMFTRRG